MRLALFVVGLFAVWLVVHTTGIIDPDAVRGAIESAGPFAPLAYIPISGVLGAIFVPGPILAGISGYLFGPIVGTVVTLGSAIVSALIASFGGRVAGREGARRVLGDKRTAWLDHQIQTRGLWAVAGQRLIPGMPDAPVNYSFGALGVPAWQMAAGTAIGSAPRAFVYTALGAVIHNPSPWLGIAAAVIWIVMAIVGLEGVRRMWKRRHEVPAAPAPSDSAEPRS
ncbi:TVP38/TMEM64 family protein [Smaragdicoccus niigatensis]|uniref:TVP38/TMEM64 family protein n=1 Tax=Smaragdicoccus niigatensis TaxID=359359 RepID=UPI0003AA576A|nr:TVP38/TMEM64 family protein [Smaragdicoccus niigatensis]